MFNHLLTGTNKVLNSPAVFQVKKIIDSGSTRKYSQVLGAYGFFQTYEVYLKSITTLNMDIYGYTSFSYKLLFKDIIDDDEILLTTINSSASYPTLIPKTTTHSLDLTSYYSSSELSEGITIQISLVCDQLSELLPVFLAAANEEYEGSYQPPFGYLGIPKAYIRSKEISNTGSIKQYSDWDNVETYYEVVSLTIFNPIYSYTDDTLSVYATVSKALIGSAGIPFSISLRYEYETAEGINTGTIEGYGDSVDIDRGNTSGTFTAILKNYYEEDLSEFTHYYPDVHIEYDDGNYIASSPSSTQSGIPMLIKLDR